MNKRITKKEHAERSAKTKPIKPNLGLQKPALSEVEGKEVGRRITENWNVQRRGLSSVANPMPTSSSIAVAGSITVTIILKLFKLPVSA
jgi:hypothetical protein